MTKYLTEDQMGGQKPKYLSDEQMGISGDAKATPFEQGMNKYVIDPVNALGSGIVRGTAGLVGLPGSAYSYVRSKLDKDYDPSQNPHRHQSCNERREQALYGWQ